MNKIKIMSVTCIMISLASMQVSGAGKNEEPNTVFGAPTGGILIEGTASYSVSSYESDTAGLTNNLTISNGPTGDSLWESAWYFRVMGQTAETTFGIPNTDSYFDNVSMVMWDNVQGSGFSAELAEVISQPGAGQAIVTSVMKIENITNNPITVDIFHYNDSDVGGTFEADSATLVNAPDHIALSDGADTAEYRSDGAGAFQVTAYKDLGDALQDAAVTNLDNSGLPFGPDDFTAGFQWSSVTLPRFGSFTVEVVRSFGVGAPQTALPVLIDDVIWRNGFDFTPPPPVR